MGHAQDDVHRHRPRHRKVLQDSHVGKDSSKLLGRSLNFKKNLSVIFSFHISGVIEKVIKQREETGERRNDIIDLVLDEMKNSSLSEDFSNDEKELILIANALVLFFAGFDSTAIGLSKVALQLIKNPDIQEKVLQEIEDILGDDDDVTSDLLNQLKYMDQVIYESMRHEAFMTSHERM